MLNCIQIKLFLIEKLLGCEIYTELCRTFKPKDVLLMKVNRLESKLITWDLSLTQFDHI